MHIALDYDGTVTEDPDGWANFIGLMRQRGHRITIVTFRKPEEETADLRWFAGTNLTPIVFTARHPKKEWCDARGIKIDVWIDDEPSLIINKSDWSDQQYEEWKKSIYEDLSSGLTQEPGYTRTDQRNSGGDHS